MSEHYEEKRRYTTHRGRTLLGLLPVRAAELKEGDGEQNVDKSTFMHGFASSEVPPLEDATAQTCQTGGRKKRIKMLDRAVTSFLKPFKEAAEGVFDDDLKGGEMGDGFSTILWSCCDVPEAKYRSAVRNGAETRQPCVRRRDTYRGKVRNKKGSSRVVAETVDMRRKVVKKQSEAASLGGGVVLQACKRYRAR